MSVRPKKHLGQHFLTDESICKRIADTIAEELPVNKVLEVGPGMGALTKYLLQKEQFETHVIELDRESVDYIAENFPALKGRIYSHDFLKIDLSTLFDEPFSVVGNYPYNISSQILFKVLAYKNQIPVVTGMFQKEVAERIAEPPGTKKYGIISVLLQAWYDIEYLFTVHENAFSPPPKVKSAVIKLTRNKTMKLDCDEKMFVRVVKTAFNQRRKTLRNSLKSMIGEFNPSMDTSSDFFQRRPETLSVEEFIVLTQRLIV
jgi:16S rRNA (adenine1518-N6/adenine1519-N6)-dimethyltransferase